MRFLARARVPQNMDYRLQPSPLPVLVSFFGFLSYRQCFCLGPYDGDQNALGWTPGASCNCTPLVAYICLVLPWYAPPSLFPEISLDAILCPV